MDFFSFETPFGRMGLGAEGDAIVTLWLPGGTPESCGARESPALLEARGQLMEYFSGARREFSLRLEPKGTAFQRRVWAALRDIPYGQTRTYADVAAAVGNPKAFRAVGSANHDNPIAIFIPCHRVVGKSGSLTGYAGGLDMKRKLLELEGVTLS